MKTESTTNNILVVSDVHLGSPVSKVKAFAKVLKNEKYNHLIVNGDLFDNRYIERYKKHHWNILSLIRKIAKTKKVTLIKGNHDISSNNIIKILGLEFVDEYKLNINGKRMLFIHFHQFDSFISKYPIITSIAEKIYYFFQSIDRSKRFSRWLKRTSKSFLQVKTKIRNKAIEFLNNKEYDAIFGGHIHYAECYVCPDTKKEYYNSGSFCDEPCHYLLINDKGNVTLKEI
jgi:DNA repair exonuclease SbcCD nuclease subunit